MVFVDSYNSLSRSGVSTVCCVVWDIFTSVSLLLRLSRNKVLQKITERTLRKVSVIGKTISRNSKLPRIFEYVCCFGLSVGAWQQVVIDPRLRNVDFYARNELFQRDCIACRASLTTARVLAKMFCISSLKRLN